MCKINDDLITHFTSDCVVKQYIFKIYKDLPAATDNIFRKELTFIINIIRDNNLTDRDELISYAVEAEVIFQRYCGNKSFLAPLK